MKIDKNILRMAGVMILASLALGAWINLWWLLLAAFVGLNLLQAGFTGFCPMAAIMKKMGMNPSCMID